MEECVHTSHAGSSIHMIACVEHTQVYQAHVGYPNDDVDNVDDDIDDGDDGDDDYVCEGEGELGGRS